MGLFSPSAGNAKDKYANQVWNRWKSWKAVNVVQIHCYQFPGINSDPVVALNVKRFTANLHKSWTIPRKLSHLSRMFPHNGFVPQSHNEVFFQFASKEQVGHVRKKPNVQLLVQSSWKREIDGSIDLWGGNFTFFYHQCCCCCLLLVGLFTCASDCFSIRFYCLLLLLWASQAEGKEFRRTNDAESRKVKFKKANFEGNEKRTNIKRALKSF